MRGRASELCRWEPPEPRASDFLVGPPDGIADECVPPSPPNRGVVSSASEPLPPASSASLQPRKCATEYRAVSMSPSLTSSDRIFALIMNFITPSSAACSLRNATASSTVNSLIPGAGPQFGYASAHFPSACVQCSHPLRHTTLPTLGVFPRRDDKIFIQARTFSGPRRVF